MSRAAAFTGRCGRSCCCGRHDLPLASAGRTAWEFVLVVATTDSHAIARRRACGNLLSPEVHKLPRVVVARGAREIVVARVAGVANPAEPTDPRTR